jgi:ketosteroid isomerase-like protein
MDRVRTSLDHLVATGEPEWSVLHADVEVYDHDILDAGDYRGLSGFGRWLEDWASAWSEFSLDPNEYLDAGDKVIVVLQMEATGAGSSVTVEREDAMVCKMRDQKVVRVDYYNDRSQALQSVGLE